MSRRWKVGRRVYKMGLGKGGRRKGRGRWPGEDVGSRRGELTLIYNI